MLAACASTGVAFYWGVEALEGHPSRSVSGETLAVGIAGLAISLLVCAALRILELPAVSRLIETAIHIAFNRYVRRPASVRVAATSDAARRHFRFLRPPPFA
jgi:hypothetical protein